jgi:hypothetical protein
VNRSFTRKVIYLVAMVALLFPLSLLSQPDTLEVGTEGSPGGRLAQERRQAGLTQASLGQIDPTSETVKLATLGMRGVAANLLWKKAGTYQMKEDWTNLSATLEQISRLQPNFISVWRYQGWNLSYNVAVEWDDYRQRYQWIKNGIDFLKDGTEYNRTEAILPWDIGWFYGHKMGTADEKKQYRVLFRHDDDLHGSRPMLDRDNWLVGKEWFLEGHAVVENNDVPVRGTNPVIFYSGPAKWQMNYADALEEDGGLDGKAVFGERAKRAWEVAHREWLAYGDRPVPSTAGVPIELNDVETHQKQFDELVQKIKDLEKETYEALLEERRKSLTEAEREALKKPAEDRNEDEAGHAYQAEQKLIVTHEDIAARVTGENRELVRKLAEEASFKARVLRSLNSSRDVVQYVYWLTRCEAERLPETIKARELMYQGTQRYSVDIDLEGARKLLEQSFVEWRKVFDQFPSLKSDRVVGDDLVGPVYLPGGIRYYEQVLKKLDEKFPKDFILQDVIDANDPDPPIGK